MLNPQDYKEIFDQIESNIFSIGDDLDFEGD